ncbi:MAG: DNA polymerase III subunit beta [Candidatus Jacksonbacteria bacterium RIFCSPLOWO2_02_FULL_43_9]|nr:MAG: polymerase III subunit beta protein [Parcubacteria group bacterium GW2011_GWA2_43_13]OGY69693.1 MAG: DNA polymerase III subunit beta [Candidatus Jacksonbacteria bacterium RIFCSPHIGHO2_02_FULL_43_10]OGY70713.1 MAG: DNA polymerase III subunit beta [Candidatus Jacksonbacteria bacterium RIFCSPLOWO2_01_FULL_44_13]OGY74305.1 MAG: DNA polymerase III subunit beta [Candidatus Jacksonbacteria bacterium RIFCSPLOWO2_02_FULL_43_9]HAZ16692.1 DNA polymerase III subunit beta [Candidatus Jacksonbacteria
MKIICTQPNLQRGIVAVSHIAGQGGTLPVLQNILLKAEKGMITFSATDLEIGITATIRGKIEQEGAFTVSSKIMNNVVGLLPDENVELEVKGQNLHIKSGGSKTKINGIEATDFPIIPTLNEGDGVLVEASAFKKALSQAIVAVSQDMSRPELNGALFRFSDSILTIAATDSYRLAEKKVGVVKKEGAGLSGQVIVPLKAIREVLRTVEEALDGRVLIATHEGQLLFLSTDIRIVTRLIEGKYPDYEHIIPKTFQSSFVVQKEGFLRAVKAAGLFTQMGVNGINVRLHPEENLLEISSQNTQTGENASTLSVSGNGVAGAIVFDYRYLSDGLNTIDQDEVTLALNEPTSPGVLRPNGKDDYIYIIMPIRS